MGAIKRASRRFLHFAILAILALGSLSSLAYARDIYFIANAVSNITLERATDPIDGGSDTGCFYVSLGTFWACVLPPLKCRVMVVNPVGSQSVNVQVTLDHNILYQQSQNSNITTLENPVTNNAGTALTYASTGSDINTAGWRGSFTALNAAMTRVDTGSTALAAGEYLVYEKQANIPSYTNVTTGVAPFSFVPTAYSPMWPYGKWFNTCSGRIRVIDVASTAPGFVLANGNLEYYTSSYQNPALPFTTASVSGTQTKTVSTGATATAKSSANAIITHSAPTMVATLNGYGRAECRADAACSCTAGTDFLVGRSAATALFPANGATSSVTPLKIGTVPIVINGGSPF